MDYIDNVYNDFVDNVNELISLENEALGYLWNKTNNILSLVGSKISKYVEKMAPLKLRLHNLLLDKNERNEDVNDAG